jgi:predicted Zn-dependent peptidase
VCIAGNINGGETVKKVERFFKPISTGIPGKKVQVLERQAKPQMLVEYRKTDQTQIALGVRGYNLLSNFYYPQELLATFLGGMMSSRLWIKIRERLGLAYSITTLNDSNPDTGDIVTSAGIRNGFVEKAVQEILKEYRQMKHTSISKEDLQKAKEHEKGRLALWIESSDAKANFYAMQELLEGRILTPEQIYAKIDQVTPIDIQRVAKDIFRPEKLNLVVLGPYREKDKFQRLLKI